MEKGKEGSFAPLLQCWFTDKIISQQNNANDASLIRWYEVTEKKRPHDASLIRWYDVTEKRDQGHLIYSYTMYMYMYISISVA